MTHRRSFAGFVLKLAAGLVFLTVLTAARSQAPGDSAASTAVEGRITPADRRYLVLELNESKIAYLKSIQGLTREQWTFKPTPDRWSVEECAEHIILAEPLLVADSNRMLATPAVSRLATANSEGDHGQVAKMLDRSVTAKAPAAITPSGRFASPDQAAAEFIKRRDATIAYAETTEDPLRSHAGDGPAGDKNDAYQVLLLLAAHSGRHTAQILEVEASPNYPRAK
jgi:hypothetical protein